MAMSKQVLLAFLCGLVFGGSFALLAIYHSSLSGTTPAIRYLAKKDADVITKTATKKVDYVKEDSTEEKRRTLPVAMTKDDFVLQSTAVPTVGYAAEHKLDNSTAEYLYEKVRVLCWIMTSPATLKSKATHVRDTWTKRCNIRLFISSKEDKEFPAVGLPLKEGRDQLYEKTKAAFTYVWENYRDQADWFMKADDDTYVVVENLRMLLKDYNPADPVFFGRKFKPFIKQGYMSGGAGYVLSKGALVKYVDGLRSKKCPRGSGIEDVEVGKCMDIIGVTAGDSRDKGERETFFPLGPRHHLVPNAIPSDNWFWKYNFYPTCLGRECCSNYVITFHYVSPEEMYIFDYFIYDVEVYGRTHLYNSNPRLWYENTEKKAKN